MKDTGYPLPYDREAFQMVDNVINTEEAGICITDFKTGKILFANNKMAFYTGGSDITGMIGKSCRTNENTGKNDSYPFCSYTNLLDRNGKPLDPYIREEYVKELDIWIKIVNHVVEWTSGHLIRIMTCYDITVAHKMREQLTDFMHKDRLLGLKNSASLEQDMQELSVKPALLLFEVLSMQKINEFYGWEIGDHLLRKIRDTILSKGIPNAQLYRVGGDKFCLAVDNINRAEAKKLAEDMFALFNETWKFEFEGTTVQVFNHVSFAVIPGGYTQKDESLLSMIERMLARAKERKKVIVYNKKMDNEYKNRLNLEWDLNRCMHENMRGFDVVYQPIVNALSKTWCGLEALCRWQSPDFGAISPSVFIPEAERLELIGTLDLWVLETSVKKCKLWELDICDNFILNVNLSASQFHDEGLAEKIITILEEYNFPGEKLCIEITESTSVTFLDRSLYTIDRLRERNILIALDDFGTGYSSFGRLKSMPVDIVKIERMFISDIENDEYHQYLFSAMTDLAHTANVKLIAEGVERKRQMDILIKADADYMQGYLFSKPLLSGDLENKLDQFYRQIPPVTRGNYFMETETVADKAI